MCPRSQPRAGLVARFLQRPAGCPRPARRRATMTTAHQERPRPEAPLELQLKGYRLATAEILPDAGPPEPAADLYLAAYVLAPDYPQLRKFLAFWAERSRAGCSASASAGPRSSPPTYAHVAGVWQLQRPRHASAIASSARRCSCMRRRRGSRGRSARLPPGRASAPPLPAPSRPLRRAGSGRGRPQPPPPWRCRAGPRPRSPAGRPGSGSRRRRVRPGADSQLAAGQVQRSIR